MLLTLTTAAQGQTSEGDYQTIDMRDGLTESRIRQIKQTADGRIAIATTGTVDIYDGTRFESYPLPPERVYQLPDYRGGHQMDCDSTGIVWLRNNRSLYAIDTRRHEVVANVDSLLRARGLTADDVTRWKKDIVAKQYGDISDVKSVLHDSYGGL